MTEERPLSEYTRRLAEALGPHLVLLAPSPAYESPKVLVIADWTAPPQERVQALLALRPAGLVVHPVGYTPEEAAGLLEAADPAILPAFREGEVLFARAPKGPPDRLLLATRNPGKARELKALLRGAGLPLLTLEEAGIPWEVPEVGKSFEENARLKARISALLAGLWALADDSGLEVDALGAGPGTRSKRYAGENATDPERVALLLKRLEDVPWESRGARFRSVIAIASPQGRVYTCEGEVQGKIAFSPRGTGGFGYDPVFYLPEHGKTMAELPLEEKNKISHRARAARKAVDLLRGLGGESGWRVTPGS